MVMLQKSTGRKKFITKVKKTKHRGVYSQTTKNKGIRYFAKCTKHQKIYYSKVFSAIKQAIKAYEILAEKLHENYAYRVTPTQIKEYEKEIKNQQMYHCFVARGKSNFRGVMKRHGKYQSYIHHNGKTRHIGLYETAQKAAIVYDIIAKKFHGKKAILNFGWHGKATPHQIECYKLCSPDFFGFTYQQAAEILGITASAICVALRWLKRDYPNLFPIRRKTTLVGKSGQQQYETWMDFEVKKQF